MEITEHWEQSSLITQQTSFVGVRQCDMLPHLHFHFFIYFRTSIGLDPPLSYYLPRLLWRTFMRLLGLRSSCAAGCKDTWGEVFSTKGIVWFCLKNHGIARTKYKAWLSRMNFQAGAKMVRLDESRGELARWKDDLEEHLQQM